MKNLILLLLLIPIISLGQEYEIKANATVAFSKTCLDKAFKAVNGGDRVAFKRLKNEGCIAIPGDKGKGLSGIRIVLVDRGLTESKFHLKGYPNSYVWLFNDQAIKVK